MTLTICMSFYSTTVWWNKVIRQRKWHFSSREGYWQQVSCVLQINLANLNRLPEWMKLKNLSAPLPMKHKIAWACNGRVNYEICSEAAELLKSQWVIVWFATIVSTGLFYVPVDDREKWFVIVDFPETESNVLQNKLQVLNDISNHEVWFFVKWAKIFEQSFVMMLQLF